MPHTEGKWGAFSKGGKPKLLPVPEGDEGFEISSEESPEWIAYVQRAENVPIILAASQMLEALERAAMQMERDGWQTWLAGLERVATYKQVSAAIAAAKGETA